MENDFKCDQFSAMHFIRSKSSRSSCKKELHRQRSGEIELPSSSPGGLITKWLKDLRVSYTNHHQAAPPPKSPEVVRSNPFYHSEGKGCRKKKNKDHRRHSFNYKQITPPPTRRRIRTNGTEVPAKPYFPAKHPYIFHTMMPSRSTPNLQQSSRDVKNPHNSSVYTYLQNQSGLSFAPVSTSNLRENGALPSPPTPPVRDSSSLKSIKYGPGHEKFPSWPVPAAADEPQSTRAPPSGGSHRSKSWTDHTNYPKEKVVTYTRPYMKRQYSTSTQQKLKTVMEKCEKIPPETYESQYDKLGSSLFLPQVDHNGKSIGHKDYSVPSPPERDLSKIQLTQADLEEYARSYQDPLVDKYNSFNQEKNMVGHLTKSELQDFMEYSQNYEDSLFEHSVSKGEEGILHLHQKQLSYAQSEGYHSYVSSVDSVSTPFLDRLRRDSEAITTRVHSSSTWEDLSDKGHEGRDSVVTTSSGSVSSSETLKWHGSMSDVSVASSSCTHHPNSRSRQLIAHSARVKTPQRHHSESVLYIGSDNQEVWKSKDSANKLKLFPLNTYTMHDDHHQNNQMSNNRLSLSGQSLSVADRVNELEKQQKYSYLDPDKKHKVPDPTLKAIQKKALLSFYERHQNNANKNSWHSEPQLAQSQLALPSVPQPPPRVQKVQLPSRRASSASDYSPKNIKRGSLVRDKSGDCLPKTVSKHHHSNSCGSLSADLLGPVIMGPSISLDDWVPEKPPERPPKNPHLRTAYPDLFKDQRIPSPDLPPPSPPTVLEDEVFNSDEPLPPPPPDLESTDWNQTKTKEMKETPENPPVDINVHRLSGVRSSKRVVRPPNIDIASGQHYYQVSYDKNKSPDNKMVLNGKVAVSQKVCNNQYMAEPLKAPLRKSDVAKNNTRVSMTEANTPRDAPPPLQPRQMRINQSMRARIPDSKNIPNGRTFSVVNTEKSQSKASYLSSRRECDRIIPESEVGSYKRTMSPNGTHISDISDMSSPATNLNSRDPSWSLKRPTKENGVFKNNNTNLLRRASMNDKRPTTKGEFLLAKSCSKEDLKKGQLVLPDVLPDNARSRQNKRPSQLSLVPVNESIPKSDRSSPKSPSSKVSLSLAQSTNPSRSPKQERTTPSPKQTCNIFTVAEPQIPPPKQTKSVETATSTTNDLASRLSPEAASTSSSPLQTSPLTLLSASPKVPSSPMISPPQTPTDPEECPNVIEGLQMIQRTEVVLRVNPCTSDASSQTEKEEITTASFPTRKKFQEEIDCEKLSEDFANQLHPSDRLKGLLVPDPDHKKPTDYVSGLFHIEIRPRAANSPFRSTTNTPSCSPPPPTGAVSTISKNSSSTIGNSLPPLSPSSPLSGTSIYFTTSEPKAKFLTRYSQDMHQYNVVKNTKDLRQKKEDLMNRLGRKLEVLRSEQLVLLEECRINDDLGEQVEAQVNSVARPHEAAKFRLHVEEVGKITSLLLGLSGRLARAENALMGMADDHVEKGILECKRDKLKDQLEEAKKLKESIDKRSTSVSNMLYKYLNSDEYADYDHFINMKAKLIMDSKEIADKIKLGEEQLIALKETLIVTD